MIGLKPRRLRSPLAGEGPGVTGSAHKRLGTCAPYGANPSSGPSGHLLPQGEKGRREL